MGSTVQGLTVIVEWGAGLHSYLEAGPGKKPHPNSHDGWQNSIPCGCRIEVLSIGHIIAVCFFKARRRVSLSLSFSSDKIVLHKVTQSRE